MAEAVFVDAERPAGPVGRLLDRLCRLFAVASGVMLVLMAAMSLASIVGRSLFDQPIVGDYELVQAMSAVAVAMALPFCQMVRGHVIVDFFTTRCPAWFNKGLDVAASLLLAAAGFVVAWRVAVGMIDLRANGDASMLLGVPTWYAYAPMVPSFCLLGCAALYTAWVDLRGGVR